MTDNKDDIAKVETAEKSATGWVKTHVAWVIGLGCLLVGFVLGHVLR